jgi:glucose-1-phosphate thymidylyltransferase
MSPAIPAPSSAPVGVILAAGKGTRIRPFSETTPKPLLPILDRPLMAWQIEQLKTLGVERIVVVIGHLGHKVVQTLGDGSRYGVHLTYVEQDETLGIAHAVGQLEAHLDGPFLLFLGDIFFETVQLDTMLKRMSEPGVDGVLAVMREPDPDLIRRNFTVQTDDAGFVRRVIEKPRHPKSDLKGCGLYMFDPAIFDSIRRTPRTALRDEYELTDAIQIFIEDGYGVVPAEVIERDLNLSTPADLLYLNMHALERSERDQYIAPDAVVEPGAVVERSVVMAGASVPAGARLEECVVLPGERAPLGTHRRCILSTGRSTPCDD